MAENSKIEWVDHSINFWWGCVEVGPGCDNCYARELSKRWGFDVWGTDKPRREMPNAFKEIARFQRNAAKEGVKRTVFINSMSDLAELLPVNHPSSRFMYEARSKFLKETVHECPDLIFIWLTKRIGNVPKIVPGEWMNGDWPANVWLVPSIVNQKEADRDIPKLLEIPAKVRGLSMEPLVGPVDISKYLWESCQHCEGVGYFPANDPQDVEDCNRCENSGLSDYKTDGIHWIITGGESGPKARPMHPNWARSLRDQCASAGVPYFHKQNGEWAPGEIVGSVFSTFKTWEAVWFDGDGVEVFDRRKVTPSEEFHRDEEPDVYRIGKRAAGRTLDGREWNEFPEVN